METAIRALALIGAIWSVVQIAQSLIYVLRKRLRKEIRAAMKEHCDYVNQKLAPTVSGLEYQVKAIVRELKEKSNG